MDGTTQNAGKISSIAIALLAGDYSLSYFLAGNHRIGSAETVNVAVEVGLANASHSLSQNAGFQQFVLNFSIVAAQSVNITFEGLGGDNIGMLLDNVSLEMRTPANVPDSGSTLALLGLGLFGAAAIRRRIR